MAILTVNGKDYELDEDGFIVNPEVWTEDVAYAFAEGEGIKELTEQHWKVMIRKLCKETGCNMKQIYELFPSGPAKGACKLAGLPKPTGCV